MVNFHPSGKDSGGLSHTHILTQRVMCRENACTHAHMYAHMHTLIELLKGSLHPGYCTR